MRLTYQHDTHTNFNGFKSILCENENEFTTGFLLRIDKQIKIRRTRKYLMLTRKRDKCMWNNYFKNMPLCRVALQVIVC